MHQKRPLGAAWWAAIGVSITAIAIAALGDSGREWLAFDRAAISSGEYWRLLTAHFTHLSWQHLFYNLTGLSVITYLVGATLKAGEWVMTWSLAIPTVSVGLWFWQPDLAWYVGLSGVLHALLTAGLLATIGRWGIDLWVVAIVVAGKLVYEQLVGPLPVSEGASGDSVIVASHLYGAISGCISGAAIAIRVRARAAI
jgi:rhomboid family GlyGly-CTERM serine protease